MYASLRRIRGIVRLARGGELGAVAHRIRASPKGCGRAGFAPASARLIRRRFFRTHEEAVPVPVAVGELF